MKQHSSNGVKGTKGTLGKHLRKKTFTGLRMIFCKEQGWERSEDDSRYLGCVNKWNGEGRKLRER